jgi:hypothetical protein
MTNAELLKMELSDIQGSSTNLDAPQAALLNPE